MLLVVSIDQRAIGDHATASVGGRCSDVGWSWRGPTPSTMVANNRCAPGPVRMVSSLTGNDALLPSSRSSCISAPARADIRFHPSHAHCHVLTSMDAGANISSGTIWASGHISVASLVPSTPTCTSLRRNVSAYEAIPLRLSAFLQPSGETSTRCG